MLHSILSCLLDSALQRTPRGGRISIHLQYLGEGIQIQISDCGQEMAEHLDMLLQSSSAVRQHDTVQSCVNYLHATPTGDCLWAVMQHALK